MEHRTHDQKRARRKMSLASRYCFLFAPNVPLPHLQVDTETWDRIASGTPRGCELPDRVLLDWLEQRAKERQTVQGAGEPQGGENV